MSVAIPSLAQPTLGASSTVADSLVQSPYPSPRPQEKFVQESLDKQYIRAVLLVLVTKNCIEQLLSRAVEGLAL